MEKNYLVLPLVQVIEQWEGEVEGISIVYQIKLTSGDHQPDGYSANCWRKDAGTHKIGGVFNEKPTRERVEAHFNQLIFDCIINAATK